jgi:hypothetical protein
MLPGPIFPANGSSSDGGDAAMDFSPINRGTHHFHIPFFLKLSRQMLMSPEPEEYVKDPPPEGVALV